jgi:predicted metal-binding protein
MVRKIVKLIPPEELQADLEMFRQKALDLGSADAKIITSGQVIIDERVRAKCMNPKCEYYGSNGNCPPHTPDLDLVRKIVHKFHYGIFIITKYPQEILTGKKDRSLSTKDRLLNHKIVAKIESQAFHSGYYLALGFGDGPCKSRYCPDKECSVLTGKGCRTSLRARSSMESWGMDVYLMATRAGWDIYPVGVTTRAEDVPYEAALGLVLIY